MNKRIMIEGMSCNHCKMRVQKALEAVEGLDEVSVNLEGGYADVQDTVGVSDETLKNVIDEAGYDVTEIKAL